MKTNQLTTDHAAREARQPEYSEYGPVWIAESYETTDECAPSSRTTWCVKDLDGYEIALDCPESAAKHIAIALNNHARMVSALTRILEINGSSGGAKSLVAEFKHIAAEAITNLR